MLESRSPPGALALLRQVRRRLGVAEHPGAEAEDPIVVALEQFGECLPVARCRLCGERLVHRSRYLREIGCHVPLDLVALAV